MKFIALCFLFVFIYWVSWQLRGLLLSEEYLRTQQSAAMGTGRKIIVIIPVFQETLIIQDTIRYFEGLVSRRIRLVFVTTEKEGKRASNPTHMLIRRVKRSTTLLLHYPGMGDKASQLNYALTKLQVSNPNSYYAVFDADSRPDPRGLAYVLEDCESALAYQMFGLYDSGNTSNLEKAAAVFQTRWSLSFELPRVIRNYEANKIGALMYFVGHGIFVRADELMNTKFPEYSLTEDVALGYSNSFSGKVWKPVPYFDRATVPRGFMATVMQSARWFAGETLLFKARNVSWGMAWPHMLHRYFELSMWGFGPPMLIVVALYSVWSGWWIGLALLFASVMTYVWILHRITLRIIGMSDYSTPGLYGGLFVRSLANCLGPAYGTYRLVQQFIGVRPYCFKKTDR